METMLESVGRKDISKVQHHYESDFHNPSLPKKPRQLSLRDFRTAADIERLKTVAVNVVELQDYAKWFYSLGTAVNKDEILQPVHYCRWFGSLGPGEKAKANMGPSPWSFDDRWFKSSGSAVLCPPNYCTWYYYFVQEGYEPTLPDMAQVCEKCAKLALAHFNKAHQCDYEYKRDSAIIPKQGPIYHLNFYACPKVSNSSPEQGVEKLFFAEVNMNNGLVTDCRILTSEDLSYFRLGHSEVQHPKDVECFSCVDTDDDTCTDPYVSGLVGPPPRKCMCPGSPS